MLQRLRENYQIRAWNRRAHKIREAFRPRIHSAHEDRDWNRRNELLSELEFEVSQYEDEVAEIRSRRLVNEARRLLLPVPRPTEDSEHWWQSQTLGTWALTDLGMSELRKAIRLEKREQRESWFAWGGLTVSVLSLVVAIMALAKP